MSDSEPTSVSTPRLSRKKFLWILVAFICLVLSSYYDVFLYRPNTLDNNVTAKKSVSGSYLPEDAAISSSPTLSPSSSPSLSPSSLTSASPTLSPSSSSSASPSLSPSSSLSASPSLSPSSSPSASPSLSPSSSPSASPSSSPSSSPSASPSLSPSLPQTVAKAVHSKLSDEVADEPILTLLVMLNGEFGNNMSKIIRGWGTARIAQREFGLNTRLVFAQQRIGAAVMSKAKSAARDIQRCLLSPSYLRTMDWTLGNRLLDSNYFHEIVEIPGSTFTLSDSSATIGDIKENLKTLSDYIGKRHDLFANFTTNSNGSAPETPPKLMVRVNTLVIYPVINEFYDAFRETFVFDNENCCGPTLTDPPRADETVLHLRNFAVELKLATRERLGFEELEPKRLSYELLGNLQSGDKIALAGRGLAGDARREGTEAHAVVSALESRNFTVRFSPGNDGMSDFCFLTHAQKEFIGSAKSTYAQFAAYMGRTRARLYQYVTPETRRLGSEVEQFRASVGDQWTHPDLRDRVIFDEYFPVAENSQTNSNTGRRRAWRNRRRQRRKLRWQFW